MLIQAILVKSFTQDATQGNPTAVILNADALSNDQMQSIAHNIGFSEIAFVQSSTVANVKIRFFTPIQEVGLCGHATIGAFHCIAQGNSHTTYYTQETGAGILNVIAHANGFIEMEQPLPSFSEYVVDRDEIADLLSLDAGDIMPYPLEIVATSTPKLMIPINSLESLFAIKPDLEGIKNYCITSGTRGFYPFTFQTLNLESDVHARQFNPLAGINEDPTTGVAAGALIGYLKKHKLIKKNNITIEQGYVLNKMGTMNVRLDDKLYVGGSAVAYGKKEYIL